jgi:hypothetical protein
MVEHFLGKALERRGQGTDRSGILCAGRVVSEVARRHDISPQHLFAWRKAARTGALSLPADTAPLFVPVVTDLHHDGPMSAAVADGSGVVHIEQAHLRVPALQHQ